MTVSEEDPTTQELRVEQFRREKSELEAAAEAEAPEETEQHGRRAEKASYLREKLEQRAEAEREAGSDDTTE